MERRPRLLARRRRAADDEDELRLLGGGPRAEDGRADEAHAPRRPRAPRRCAPTASPRWRGRRGCRPRASPASAPSAPVEHRVERLLVGDAGEDEVPAGGALARRPRELAALRHDVVRLRGGPVPDGEVVAGLAKVVRDGLAHRAEPEEPDPHAHVLPSRSEARAGKDVPATPAAAAAGPGSGWRAAAVSCKAPRPMADADVIVVGGGISGLALAWKAAAAGRRVLVLEREGAGGRVPPLPPAAGRLLVRDGRAHHVQQLRRVPRRRGRGGARRGDRRARPGPGGLRAPARRPGQLAHAPEGPAPARLARGGRPLPARRLPEEGRARRSTRTTRGLVGRRNYDRLLSAFFAAVPSQKADGFPVEGPGSLFKKRPRRRGVPAQLRHEAGAAERLRRGGGRAGRHRREGGRGDAGRARRRRLRGHGRGRPARSRRSAAPSRRRRTRRRRCCARTSTSSPSRSRG